MSLTIWSLQKCFSPYSWKYALRPPEVIIGTGTHPIIVEIDPPFSISAARAELDPSLHTQLSTGITFECGGALLAFPNEDVIVTVKGLREKTAEVFSDNGYGPFEKVRIVIKNIGANTPGDHFLRVWAHLLKDGQPIEPTFVFFDSEPFKVESESPNPPRLEPSPAAI